MGVDKAKPTLYQHPKDVRANFRLLYYVPLVTSVVYRALYSAIFHGKLSKWINSTILEARSNSVGVGNTGLPRLEAP